MDIHGLQTVRYMLEEEEEDVQARVLPRIHQLLEELGVEGVQGVVEPQFQLLSVQVYGLVDTEPGVEAPLLLVHLRIHGFPVDMAQRV
jgi:hypothetical protein